VIDVSPALTTKILKANGEVDYRLTYRALTDVEWVNAAHVCRWVEFDLNILEKFGPEATPDDFPDLDIPAIPEHDNFDDVDYAGRDDEWVKRWRAFTGDWLTDGLTGDADDEIHSPSLASMYNCQRQKQVTIMSMSPSCFLAATGNSLARGTVIGQKRDARGGPIGGTNANPIMDSHVYRIEFDDGDVCELTLNIIAESMYASWDADGNEYILFDSYVDYKSNRKAVTKVNQRFVHNGCNSLHRSTVRWNLCVQWKDGSTSWQSLKELKETYPIPSPSMRSHKGLAMIQPLSGGFALCYASADTLLR
jgi:hypothetical protein